MERSLREKALRVYGAREKLRCELGREPVLSELAEATELSVCEIAELELAVAPPESLQQEQFEGVTLEETLGGASPEDGMVERLTLRACIDALPEREQKTILLRFFKGLTQEQTALMMTIYLALDGYGPAANVTGDGAVALALDRFFGKAEDSPDLQSKG